VYDKPLGLKFGRGSDGGAYLVSKTAAPEYAQFEVGDKILEVRRERSRARLESAHAPLPRSASFGPEVWKAENYGQSESRRSPRRARGSRPRLAASLGFGGGPRRAPGARARARASHRPRRSRLRHQDALRRRIPEDGAARRRVRVGCRRALPLTRGAGDLSPFDKAESSKFLKAREGALASARTPELRASRPLARSRRFL